MNYTLLDQFAEWFDEKVGAGEVSPLSDSEQVLLTLFVQWLEQHAPQYAAAPDLLAALESVEWERDPATGYYYCPWCLHWRHDTGHTPDCQRQAALARARGGE